MREDDKSFHALVVLQTLTKYVLHQAYDALGHSTARTYLCLKQLYFLKGLRKDINTLVKQCMKCRQQNLCPQCCAQLHLEVSSAAVLFIVMEFIGMFKLMCQGYQYALTIIDMLTDYTWCIPFYTKEPDEAEDNYLVKECYVWRCWLTSAILLRFVKGYNVMYIFYYS